MSILDLSKLHMYSFYYDVLKGKYNEMLGPHIPTLIVSLYMRKFKMYMMTSTKLTNEWISVVMTKAINVMTQPTRKYYTGKFKDEYDGKIVTKFVGLKPKSYVFKVYNEGKEEEKFKGNSKA